MILVRELERSEVEYVDGQLPLSRLDESAADRSTYLIAWEDGRPVGHAHLAWQGTHLAVPEIQDVYAVPDRRRRGIATLLTRSAEDAARARGWIVISLSVSKDGNPKPGDCTSVSATSMPASRPCVCPERSRCAGQDNAQTLALDSCGL